MKKTPAHLKVVEDVEDDESEDDEDLMPTLPDDSTQTLPRHYTYPASPPEEQRPVPSSVSPDQEVVPAPLSNRSRMALLVACALILAWLIAQAWGG